MRRRWGIWAAVAVVSGPPLLVACGDDGEDAHASGAGAPEARGAGEEIEELRIHVSNDDGIEAPGLDVVVEALHTLDEAEITIISPLEDQSGSGDRLSERLPDATEGQTISGRDAFAVEGTPADSVVWAHEEYFTNSAEVPHLTVSGSNGGQNVGWLAYISGTVGVARESARQGVPGLAVSQQFGDQIGDYDLPYATAIPFLLDWIEEHREALLARQLPLDTVASLNVPTCAAGEVRGLIETRRDPRDQGEDGLDVFAPSDCTTTEDPGGLLDVEALQVGYATLTLVDVEDPGESPSGTATEEEMG